MNAVLFWLFAAIAVGSALVVVTKRSPLGSALALSLNMIALAGLFAGLSAAFLFIIQILVYAGAVVVLIVFVIMLLQLREDSLQLQALQKGRFAAVAVVCLLAAVVLVGTVAGDASSTRAAALPAGFGTVEDFAGQLFTRFLLPFEVVSLILLVGIIGAVVIAKRED